MFLQISVCTLYLRRVTTEDLDSVKVHCCKTGSVAASCSGLHISRKVHGVLETLSSEHIVSRASLSMRATGAYRRPSGTRFQL